MRIRRQFHVLAIAEHGGIHKPFVDAAKIWLDKLAKEKNFSVDYIEDTSKIDDEFLAKYKLFIQLNYPPYGWTDTAAAAFVKYIEQGKGGWIGFHHATLLGEFDGFQMWPWFHDFMGGIRFKDYIATFVTGTVTVEAPDHPVMRGVPSKFVIKDEEWYTYDKSPRPNVHVLASVDEKTYTPETDKKMGGSSGDLVERAFEGAERLHFYGASAGAFWESGVYEDICECDFLGGGRGRSDEWRRCV